MPVLLYHHLAPADLGLHRTNPMIISVEQFRQQMAFLKSQGYVTPDLARVAAYVERGQPLPPRSVVITFDDGYQSFLQYAVPILREFGFRAVVFAIGDRTPETAEPFAPDRLSYLSWQQIQELRKAGWDVEGHTFGAHNLVDGRPAALGWDERRALADLDRLAAAYRQHGLAPPNVIAYPYGAAPRALVEAARKAGYRLGFTGARGWVRPGDDPLRLRRLPVLPWMSLDYFRLLVAG